LTLSELIINHVKDDYGQFHLLAAEYFSENEKAGRKWPLENPTSNDSVIFGMSQQDGGGCVFNSERPWGVIFVKTIEQAVDGYNAYVEKSQPAVMPPELTVKNLLDKIVIHELGHQLSMSHLFVYGSHKYCHDEKASPRTVFDADCKCFMFGAKGEAATVDTAFKSIDNNASPETKFFQAVKATSYLNSSLCICEHHRDELFRECSFYTLQTNFPGGQSQ
jgi:hypothetical protein